MKIKDLKGKKLVGHYDIDKPDDLSPYFVIAQIEYYWGWFYIKGNSRGCYTSMDEEKFFELVSTGRNRVNDTHDYWIE